MSIPQPPRSTRRGLLAYQYFLWVAVGSVSVFLGSGAFWPVPMIVMFIYLGSNLAKAQKEGLTLEFADSFYYLGFTLTITSLLAALKPFERELPEPSTILHYFGLGLLTTVCGVVGRTVLQLFYRTPSENLEDTNRQIEEEALKYLQNLRQLNEQSADMLRSTIGVLSQDLDNGLHGIQASLAEFNARLKDDIADLGTIRLEPARLKKAFTRMSETVEHAAEALVGQITSLHEAQRNVTVACESSCEALSEHAARIGNLQTTVAEGVDSVGRTFNDLRQRVANIEIDAEPLEDALQRFGDAIEKGSTPILARLAQTGQTAANTLAETLRQVQASLNSLDASELRNAISSLSEASGRLKSVTEQNEAASRASAGAIGDFLASAMKRAQEVNQTLDEIIDAVHVKLDKLELSQ